jgi:hypothetical protein
MTAEIAVMNRQGLALAADSALTARRSGDEKAWQSANKIFGLTRNHSVGVMIYGSAEFMRIPWETLIKLYRDQLQPAPFTNLYEYSDSLVSFLRSRIDLFPREEQTLVFSTKLWWFYRMIREDLGELVDETISYEGKPIGVAETQELLSALVVGYQEALSALEPADELPVSFRRTLRSQYGSLVPQIKRDVFQKLPLTAATSRRLTTIAWLLFEKARFSPDYSGVVVAGYGSSDIFPVVAHMRVEGFVAGKLNFGISSPSNVTRSMTASVQAFAQGDEVYAFMEGVAPRYQLTIDEIVERLIHEYPDRIIQLLPKLTEEEKQNLLGLLAPAAADIHKDYVTTLQNIRQRYYWSRIIDVVSVLPKDELADMAETLVSLASFRHKMSMSVESVGGPIDVAVISKGDGFVWVKRKKYFELAENPHVWPKYLS